MPAARLIPEIYCANLERSLEFFIAVLGFTVAYERPEERFAFLEREGAQIMLSEPVGRVFLAGALEHPYGRGVHFQIEVSDASALYEHVAAAGRPIFLHLEERWYRRENELLGQRQFGVQDPDGYLIRFFEAIGRRPAVDGA
jgi:catechol 2,3-dioxygenase-like lactoylglutathione lyase family enzyme